jgi:uncharacterized protein
MPHANPRHHKRLNAHLPLVFDTRGLGPADARSVTRNAPAPAGLGVAMTNVPEGAELELDVLLEGVAEGVLVTASLQAPLTGECARCLEVFTTTIDVRFTELFARDASEDDADGYLLVGDLLDLEPALRDALVLELPLAPLCADDCPGLCPECGVRLADAGAGHGHAGDVNAASGAACADDQDPATDAGAAGATPASERSPVAEGRPVMEGRPVVERRRER